MDNFFNCYLWWVILGVFIGFLLFWLYDLLFRRDGSEQQVVAAAQSDTKIPLNTATDYGFKPSKNGQDDLTIIEGIGPKISQILIDHGISTFSDLAGTEYDRLQAILDQSGPAYKLAKPDSWPMQANLANQGEWEELKLLQDRLVGGIEFNDK